MIDTERVTRVINWLIFEGFAKNNKDLAEKMGYKESSFSQILNKKVPISIKFIKKLSILDSRIDENWLLTGEGNMLKNTDSAEISGDDRTTKDQLIKLLEDKILLLERTVADKVKIINLLEIQNSANTAK